MFYWNSKLRLKAGTVNGLFLPIPPERNCCRDRRVLLYWKLLQAILFMPVFFVLNLCGQSVNSSIPAKISREAKYLFYLHGAVVTVLGNNAINAPVPHYGPYEYLNILDTLSKRGFYVVSERRFPDVNDSVYVNKIIRQIDSLLQRGARPENITVIGASAGWSIGLRVSSRMQNDNLRFILMGGCWPDTYKDYESLKLHGHFLSIIEASDPHGTCTAIFRNRNEMKSFKEITLHTGREHGFFYKGYKEWVDPVVEWTQSK